MKDLESIHESLAKNSSAVLFVSSSECCVCTAVHAKLLELEGDYPDTLFLTAKLEDVPGLSGLFLVLTVPTILVFANEKEHHRESRFIDFPRLEKYIQETLHEKRPYDEGLFNDL